jgi:hypothetical protein
VSVLLVGLDPSLARAVVARLTGEGDQVRAVVGAGEDPRAYEGAHVATGDPADDDLVERAAQGARTIVVGVTGAARAAALSGASRAGVDRAVFLGPVDADEVPAGMSWVALLTPRPRLGLRRGPSPESVAEAVDAADDLAGDPALVADLGTVGGWASLLLEPPG